MGWGPPWTWHLDAPFHAVARQEHAGWRRAHAGPLLTETDGPRPPPSLPGWRTRLSPDPARGAWVALGKFDALHRGHAALAAWAAARPGVPWLISFSGMASVLGWRERLPLVAPSDRPRVLATWGEEFGVTPRELCIPFAEVRFAKQAGSCCGEEEECMGRCPGTRAVQCMVGGNE